MISNNKAEIKQVQSKGNDNSNNAKSQQKMTNDAKSQHKMTNDAKSLHKRSDEARKENLFEINSPILESRGIINNFFIMVDYDFNVMPFKTQFMYFFGVIPLKFFLSILKI